MAGSIGGPRLLLPDVCSHGLVASPAWNQQQLEADPGLRADPPLWKPASPLKNRNCVLLVLLSGGGSTCHDNKRHLKPLKEYLQWNHLWLSGYSPAFPNLSIVYSGWPLKKLNNRFIIMLRGCWHVAANEKLPTHRYIPTFTYTHAYVPAYLTTINMF